MKKAIQELIEISTFAGSRVDYTQGGGGNTSVKDGEVMYIKASGFKLIDIAENTGYVPMDYKKVKAFTETAGATEEESKKVTASAILKEEGLPELRPSVEAGFHSVLSKYVIHTHSVYANILTCAAEGKKLAAEIFGEADFGFVFLPYIDPGFTLSVKMKEALDEYKKLHGKTPEVIFMQNHGLVVHADDKERAMETHKKVNDAIREKFALPEIKEVVLKETAENVYESETPFIKHFAAKHGITKELFDRYPLYPDQLVYLNNVLEHSPEKLETKGGVVYHTGGKEAKTLEETLFAYSFVLDTILSAGLNVSVMSEKDVAFINNWEAEKYRRSVASK